MKPDIEWIEDFIYRAYMSQTPEAEQAWQYEELSK
jgi:hypothetical protein